MLTEKRSTKFGAALIIFAVLLRMALTPWQSAAQALRQPEQPETTGSFLRETTGALAPTSTKAPVVTQPVTTPPPVTEPAPTLPSLTFSAADLEYIRVQYATDCPHRPDLEALLLQSLDWDLSSSEPTVLIIHSHASESYTPTPGQDYKEHIAYRTLNEAYNMLSVGDCLARLLQAAGICVLHDRQIHDYPSYTASYTNSRTSVQEYLAQYPTIQVVLDLHRDAADNADGNQYATSCIVDGQKAAQLMFVVGTNASGNYHPHWQDNLATALKLQVLLEQLAPGITRQTVLRAQRFNHDLSPGALIVEVGAAGNTLEEAMRAIPVLAQALTALIHGANT